MEGLVDTVSVDVPEAPEAIVMVDGFSVRVGPAGDDAAVSAIENPPLRLVKLMVELALLPTMMNRLVGFVATV